MILVFVMTIQLFYLIRENGEIWITAAGILHQKQTLLFNLSALSAEN